MLRSHTEKQYYSQLFYFENVLSVSECLFVFWVCVIPPTYNLPRNISMTWVASLQKTLHTAAMEVSKRTGSMITDSTRPKKPWPPSN